MIGLRQSNNSRRLERCGFQALCSFDLYWKSSRENPERLLKSSGISLDFLKKIGGNIKDFDFESFRSTLVASSKANFNENDRLCYIDNDNDEIPIDQQSEFLEALKFAQASCNEKQKNVPLIIIKAKEKSEKSPQKIKTTNSSSKNPSDKMPPMKVESTATCDMTIADSTEHELALRWFHDFLEGFKKEIVADVTKEVFKKMTSAMLLSQNLDTVESPSPEASHACPEIPQKSTITINDPSSRAKINTLYRATLPVKNPQGGNNTKAKSSIFVTTKTQLPGGGQIWKENDGQSDYLITRTVLPQTIHYSADKISGSVPGPCCGVLPPGPTKIVHITESSPGYFPIPMNIDAKQTAPATPIINDEKIEVAKEEVFPLVDEKKIKIIEGEDYDITVVAWKDKESEQKMDEFIKSFKEHQNNRNDLSSEEEKAGSSGKSPSNENNRDVSEKQPPSDSDNISILSDNSHMSDFIVEDENYEVIQTEEPPKSEGVDEARRESSSSFELVSESPSPIDVNEQFSPDKKVPKPMIYVHFGQPGTSNAAPRENVPSPVFAVDTQGKAYTKNIAETPEDIVIDPQLDKRSGGAYSFVTYNLENSKEKIVDSGSSKPTKVSDVNFKFFKVDEKPQETFFFANKATAEQQNPSTEPQAPQPQRRVVFDHNTSKGLGDTKQTSPKKRATNKTGETHRRQTFSQSSHAQHQYFHPRPQHCFFQTHAQFPEPPGNFENWTHCYSGQAPIPQPWQTGYPYPDTMQILPETLISGAVQAASSAYTTARKVIEKIRSPQPGAPDGPKPRKM